MPEVLYFLWNLLQHVSERVEKCLFNVYFFYFFSSSFNEALVWTVDAVALRQHKQHQPYHNVSKSNQNFNEIALLHSVSQDISLFDGPGGWRCGCVEVEQNCVFPF